MRRSAVNIALALCVLWALYSLMTARLNIRAGLTRNRKPKTLLGGCGEHSLTVCSALPMGQVRLECLFRRTLAHIELPPAKHLRSAAKQFILCAVITQASRMAEPRAAAVTSTWGAQCDELLLLSSSRTAAKEMQLPAQTRPKQWPALRALRAAYNAAHARGLLGNATADFFVVLANDETYVIMPNLRELLRGVRAGAGRAGEGVEPGTVLGQRVHVLPPDRDPFKGRLILHPATSVVLSRGALIATARCGEWGETTTDVVGQGQALAECFRLSGVWMLETRGRSNAETFHFLDPATVFSRGGASSWQLDSTNSDSAGNARRAWRVEPLDALRAQVGGADCCSKNSVSFGGLMTSMLDTNISPLRIVHELLYHCKH